jgi:hypothetical protein
MSLFPVLIFFSHALLHISQASQCSELNLTPLNTNNDENYFIQTERIKSSNIIKVSLILKQIVNDTSWFIMGASDTSKLIGSWEPFSSADGQVIDCSTSTEKAVTNQNSSRLQFSFYWMAPPSFSNTVIFVATIFDGSTGCDQSSLRYIQSTPTEIEQIQGRDRYQDVSQSKLFNSNHFIIE